MDEQRDQGLQALALLQAGILAARALAFEGGNSEAFFKEASPDLIENLKALDLYLTGSTESRRRADDERELYALIVDYCDWLVHLSDGGYSRLRLRLEAGLPVVMDLGLSSDSAKRRWSKLFPAS